MVHSRPLPWRETSDPYCIWISEVMLQQTQVKTVTPYYENFLRRFPSVHRLAGTDLQDVLKIWEGLGYYARARNLHMSAKIISERHGGMVPNDDKALRELPGIGDYIASAILSIAFGKSYAVVDGNVKRVLARIKKIHMPVNLAASNKTFKDIAARLLDKADPGRFNQAMMELGAMVCTPRRPGCAICPVKTYCQAFRADVVDQYPKRDKKAKVPQFLIATGVLFKGGKVLITRRKSEGLLGGLWEFPGGKVRKDDCPMR